MSQQVVAATEGHYPEDSTYSNRRIRKAISELRTAVGHCQNPMCGSSTFDFAHLKPTPLSDVHRGRGRKERFYDVVKNPDCYTALCPYDHRKFDSGHLAYVPKSLLELFPSYPWLKR